MTFFRYRSINGCDIIEKSIRLVVYIGDYFL